MINPGDIVDALVAALASIPELSAAQGDGEVRAYHPIFAAGSTFQRALHAAKPGDILVRWLGTGPGLFGENRVWKHLIGIYVRPFDTTPDDDASQHYLAANLILDGVPGNAGEKLMNLQLLPDLDPMDIPTLQVVIDPEGLEYFLITFSIPEIGDN